MKQGPQLPLDRCPHCSIARPKLDRMWGSTETAAFNGSNKRAWSTYKCASCGGVVLVVSPNGSSTEISQIWPTPQIVEEIVPVKARMFLEQAIECLHAPAGAVMLTASSVDAMLKDKGYKEGSLYQRIDIAARDHLITNEMAKWAHEIRLDANDQRHADENAQLPSKEDAEKVIEFAKALTQFLYVLPDRVARRGITPKSGGKNQ